MRKKMVPLVVFAVMSVLTIAYAVYVVYSMTNNTSGWHYFEYYEPEDYDHVYYAVPYEGEPSKWYSPEELAIGGYWDNDGSDNGFWIIVDRDKEPFDLQTATPVFKLNGRFYQVSGLWVTPSLPKSPNVTLVGGAVCIGMGWLATGIVYYRWIHEKVF